MSRSAATEQPRGVGQSMRNVGKQEKNFSRFKSGHASALYDLLESERPFLYDYLMRMTSQVSRSADSINEVYESLSEEVISVIESARDLRLVLYTTARRFNSDIWNAETSRLINAALQPTTDQDQSGHEAEIHRDSALLDKALRSLPGPQREVVWLHILGGFSFEEVAQIVGVAESGVETLYLGGVGALDAEAEETCGPAQTALPKLPPHPLPTALTNATVNLSMIMAGIKVKPTGIRSVTRMILLGLAVVCVVIWYTVPHAVIKSFLPSWMPFLNKF